MRPTAGVPMRPLAVLALAVLALHALALWMAPGAARPTLRPAPWQWRTIGPQRPPAPTAGDAAQPQARPSPPLALRQRPAPEPHRVAPPARPRPAAGAATPAPDAGTAAVRAEPAAAAGAAVPLAGPIALPAPALWHYAVSARHRGRLVTGEAHLAWRHDGHWYEAELRISAPPLPPRIQRSTGTLGPEGLEPLRFSERLRGEQAAHFDRARGRIVFSGNGPDVALQPGAQDRLGVLLQLAARVAAEPARFAPGTTVLLQVATARDAADWPFGVAGTEPLPLAAGPVTALKLVRAPRHEWDPRIEVWLVPGGDYGPARLRLTAPNGDWLDLQKSGTDKG